MKNFSVSTFLFCTILTIATADAAQPSPSHANNRPIPKPAISTPASTRTLAPVTKKPEAPATTTAPTTTSAQASAPAQTATPKTGALLNAYIAELAADVPLSKDEQAGIKTAYADDAAKLKDILNNASLSPLEQTQQVDDLRDTRNARIEDLLHDADRQQKFLHIEANYRVALIELAASGGLISTTPQAPAR